MYQVNVSARVNSGSVMPKVIVTDSTGSVQTARGFGGPVQGVGSMAAAAGQVHLEAGWRVVAQFGASGTVNGEASVAGADQVLACKLSIALQR